MADQPLFNSDDSGNNESLFDASQGTPPVDQTKDYVAELVGEGKKFKDAQALARAKVESDAFIARLQNEAEGLRQELKSRATIEEFMDRMNSNDTPPRQDPPVNDGGNQEQPDIQKLIADALAENDKKRSVSQNAELVTKTLKAAWGDNYNQKVVAKANELGLGLNFLEDLAKSQPKAFFQLVGVNDTRDNRSTPNALFPDTNQESRLTNRDSHERNETYYANLRRTDPTAYWSPQTQNQLHKDALRLGEKFFT